MNNEIEAFIEKKFLNIFVVGVGKGGVSAINMIHDKRGSGIEYLICDTDEMLLNKSQVKHKIHIKEKNTLSEHNKKQIKEYTEKAKVVILMAGMGGDIGEFVLPKIIETIGNKDLLTVSILTIPFVSEGTAKIERAKNCIEQIRFLPNTVIELNSQLILEKSEEKNLSETFEKLNTIQFEVLTDFVKSLPWNSYLSTDYGNFLSILKDSRQTVIGSGNAVGEDRVKKAIDIASKFSLFEETNLVSYDIFYLMIQCSQENQFKMSEIEQIHSFVDSLRTNISFIWSACFDNDLDESVKVVAIAGKLNNKYFTDKVYSVDKVYF